ncbi:MAG: hypothetical protein ACR2OV_15795 [Hyphomicrobiaceae bacterium]
MADVTPEMRERLSRLRERISSGEMTPEQLREANVIIQQIEGGPPGILVESTPERGPETIEELTGGFVGRSLFEMIGGSGGMLLAGGTTAPSGPGALVAGAAGGALGAGAGSAAFDNTTDFLRALGVLATPSDATTGFERAGEIALRAGQAGVEDATFAAGGQVIGAGISAVGKPLIGRLLGLRSNEAQEIIRVAQQQGIDVGATTAATGLGGRAARAISNVMGVFPFMGPVREGIRGQLRDVSQRTAVLLDNFGPNATLQSQLGINMIEAAQGARQEFVRVAGDMYDQVRLLSNSIGNPKIIPTADIQSIAEELAASQRAGTLFTRDGAPIARPTDDKLGDFIEQLSNVEDAISLPQYRQLSDDLAETVSTLRAQGFDVGRVAQIRQRMEEALSAMDLRVPGAMEIADALTDANRFYSDGIVRFQNPTAQRFGRVDRNIFGAGREVPGSINPDEAADIVTNLRSADSVRDLRALVGQDVMNQAARGWLDDAFQSAIREGDEFISPDLLRRNLGLTGPNRIRREALEEFLGADTLNNVIKVSQTLDNILQMPNVNRFIARRTILGGVRSLLTGTVLFGGGAAAGGIFGKTGVVPTVAATYLARRAGAIMNDPFQMEALTRVITDTDMTNLQRRALFGRLLEANGDVLSVGISGPPEVQNLSLEDAFDNPAARFVIDFLTTEEAENLQPGPGNTP